MQPIVTNHWSLVTRRGQALIELAVFGTLVIMAIGLLIRFGLTFNARQELTMASFRNAIREVRIRMGDRGHELASAQYSLVDDRLLPDPADPLGLNQRSRVGGSGTAVWGQYLTFLTGQDHENKVFFRINNSIPIEYNAAELPRPREQQAPLGDTVRQIKDKAGTLRRDETTADITNVVTAKQDEQLDTTINLRGNKEQHVITLFSQDTNRDWETPHAPP